MSIRGLRRLLLMTSVVAMLQLSPALELEARTRQIEYEHVLSHPVLMEEFARMVSVTESNPRDIEMAAFLVLDASNRLRLIQWDTPNNERTNTWTGPVPRGAIATVHTHPNGWRRPSHEDHEEATRTGLPFLVLTRWDIWVAEPDSGRSRALLRNENWRDERYLAALDAVHTDEASSPIQSAAQEALGRTAPPRLLLSDY